MAALISWLRSMVRKSRPTHCASAPKSACAAALMLRMSPCSSSRTSPSRILPVICVNSSVFSLQLAQLRLDLDVLVVDALEQRRELLIGVVIERVLEIEAVERIDDAPRQALGQHAREDERHNEHEQQRLEHTDGDHADRRSADGDARPYRP